MEKKNLFSKVYGDAKKSLVWLEDNIQSNLVKVMKENLTEPLKIGNMVYWYTTNDGKDVPTYAYQSEKNLQTNSYAFRPIFDRYCSKDFGWSDFEECCRIFDVIYNHLLKLS